MIRSTITHRLAARRSQAGFTFIELVMALGISAMIILPLLSWMIMAFRSQEVVVRSSAESLARNELTVHLPQDVGSSAAIVTGGSDCSATPPAAGPAPDRVLLNITRGGATAERVSYVLHATSPTEGDLVRRECDATGTVLEQGVVVESATLDAALTTATCDAVPSRPGDPCGRVTFVVGQPKLRSVTAVATRHVGAS